MSRKRNKRLNFVKVFLQSMHGRSVKTEFLFRIISKADKVDPRFI